MQTNSAICPNTMKATRASAASPALQYRMIPATCGLAGGVGENSNVGSTRFRKRRSDKRFLGRFSLLRVFQGRLELSPVV